MSNDLQRPDVVKKKNLLLTSASHLVILNIRRCRCNEETYVSWIIILDKRHPVYNYIQFYITKQKQQKKKKKERNKGNKEEGLWSAKVAHIWSFSLTIISTCVHHTSTEFPHAIGVFKQKFIRKLLSDMWCESVVRVLSWIKSSIWGFVAPQEKEISSRTTLVIQLSWEWHAENKRSSCLVLEICWIFTMFQWFGVDWIIQNYR